jgi:DNA-binding NarL/FixJ family response regulator
MGQRNEGWILIVEDDAGFRRSLTRLARSFGEPLAAADVGEAESMLASSAPASLIAVIIDVGLPDGDGLDLAAKIRRAHPAAPILIATARSLDQVETRAERLDAAVLFKPFAPTNLIAFLRRAQRDPVAAALRLAEVRASEPLRPAEARLLVGYVRGLRGEVLRRRLGITKNTVKSHTRRLLDKLGAETLAGIMGDGAAETDARRAGRRGKRGRRRSSRPPV